MADKAGRTKKLMGFWIRLIVFTAILLIALTYVIYILTPKYPYGISSMIRYYEAEPVDVLAVGTSLTYADLNTNILWAEYGIASYDLASAEQPFWSTYYYLKEALKRQKPKLVLLDIKAITYQEDKVKGIRTILCSYGILSPVHRLKCIYECVWEEDFPDFALAFPVIHSNYANVTASDYNILASSDKYDRSWKGFIEKNATVNHETPVLDFSFNTALNVNPHEQEFFEKILELCVQEDVPVMLVGYPNADYRHDHLFYCTAFEIARKYGVTGINYNLPENRPGINYSTDCADWQHLNLWGSAVFTRALGKDLKEIYHLEDHRGDPEYASYDQCTDEWFLRFPALDRRQN